MKNENLRRIKDRTKKISMFGMPREKTSRVYRSRTQTKQIQAKLEELRYFAREMKLVGEDELASKISCAISAIAGTENPKTEYSYSSIMRDLRKGKDERRLEFQRIFKNVFDDALDNELEDPERVALMAAMKAIDYA